MIANQKPQQEYIASPMDTNKKNRTKSVYSAEEKEFLEKSDSNKDL